MKLDLDLYKGLQATCLAEILHPPLRVLLTSRFDITNLYTQHWLTRIYVL